MAKVAYIYDEELRKQCDKLPTMRYRATKVQELITAYEMHKRENLETIKCEPATESDLKSFHSSDYVEFVKQMNDSADLDDCDATLQEQFGLTYDCPLLGRLYDFMRSIAGGTLTAAKILTETDYNLAINWFGGWHHAQRDEAEGFCYVNDIVIGIQKLTEKYNRVLYVDLDVHHGNGVQNAFELSKRVLTLSIHKHSPGFYPGTGSLEDVGTGNGKYFSINVPLMDGIGDATYANVFELVFKKVFNAYNPSAMVIQCGADILIGDSIGQCNVSLSTMGDCIKTILKCNLPTMFLGGGGYNFPNAARYWTYLTSIILDVKLSDDIPDNSLFFTDYGPTYELFIYPGNMKDCNTDEYINFIDNTISGYCEKIKLLLEFCLMLK